ncbi:MAG TPA: hypothetical protein VFD76_03055 [Gemmatimonadales bacterium]|jgi:hypothetical protein|nr:hypothetical protein [Gemmatimonadales bacterium]
MSLAHQNLAVAVGAAKQLAKSLLLDSERDGTAPTGRSSALYLSLMVMHKQLLVAEPPPPPVSQFAADLEQLARACKGRMDPVKPLIEAAVRVAREM